MKIKCSQDAYNLIGPLLEDLVHEEFWIICLNRSNSVISREKISSGGMYGTVVDPKIIFANALRQRATSIILYHNHPSGQLKPSQADLALTAKLVAAGKLLDIVVQDHLIIGHGSYLSFVDEGLIQI